MIESLLGIVQSVSSDALRIISVLLVLGSVFAVLTHFWPCNRGRPWWRNRQLIWDLCYAFIIPLFNRFVRLAFGGTGSVVLFGITTAEEMLEFYENGHGPLA